MTFESCYLFWISKTLFIFCFHLNLKYKDSFSALTQRNENNTNTNITQFQEFIELQVLCTKAPFSALKSWERVILAMHSYHLRLAIFPDLKHWLLTWSTVSEKVTAPPDASSL